MILPARQWWGRWTTGGKVDMSNRSLVTSNRVSVVTPRILKVGDLRLARENDQPPLEIEKIAL
jgi:hypothetical protein